MEQALTSKPTVEDQSPARRAVRERAEAEEREAMLFAWSCNSLDAMFRLGHRDAPERAQRLLEDWAAKAAQAQQEMAQLAERITSLADLLSAHSGRARQISGIMQHHMRRRTYDKDEGPTPETKIKPKRRDPVAALVEKGHLDHAHQAAAVQIAECFELACKAGMARARDYSRFLPPPKKSGAARDDSPPTSLDDRHADVYLPWTRELQTRRGLNLPFVFDIVVDGYSLDAASKYRRVGWERGLDMLRTSLELWGEFEEKARAARRPAQGPRSRREARTA